MVTNRLAHSIAILAFTGLNVAFVPSARAEMAPGAAADVVSVRGLGEIRATSNWTPAEVDKDLFSGNLVRTREFSGMGILFQDRTQIRLSEKTTLEVKAVGDRMAAGNTTLSLTQGRAWTQTKRAGGTLTMETPAATAAIRGTDWDLEVLEDGTATITVLSGTVRFFNDFGTVTVNANEQARARVGQAPVKLTVVNPRDRVQWVSAYVASPRRWLTAASDEQRRLDAIAERINEQAYASAIAELRGLVARGGHGGAAAHLMSADLYMALGDVDRAIATVEDALARFPDDPTVKALAARLYLITDRQEAARQQIEAALARNPNNQEALLVAAQMARLNGDEAGARTAYEAAINGHPLDPRGWHGLGIVEAEKEDVTPARAALLKAIELDAEERGFQGELGTLETFADNFKDATVAFDAALERNPDDYVALTGQGLMKLKRGKTQDALDDFLRAGLLEPRYARAHMYAAVAYYQLGFIDQALDEMAAASRVDPKDPLPHFLSAMIYTDLFMPGQAVASARKAQELMPYLKSLNQVANNQQGTANLGRAYAFFGLSEWANTAAQESYYPYWAGSHLFLADRYLGLYTKNSELFQGFLADPTVFGASNRNQTLFEKPGLYFTGAYAIGDTTDVLGRIRLAEARGFSNAVTPAAFFLQRQTQESSFAGVNTDNEIVTVALGVRPTHELGFFTFANSSVDKSIFTGFGTFIGERRLEVTRVDVGAHYKFNPTSQFWIKIAKTESDDDIGGYFGQIFYPIAVDQNFHTREVALRHTVDLGRRHELTWGVEWAEKETNAFALSYTFPGIVGFVDLEGLTYDYLEDYKDVYVSHRFQVTPRLLLHTDIHLQGFDRNAQYVTAAQAYDAGFNPLPGLGYLESSSEDLSMHRISPRFGMVYRFDDNKLIRLAYQNWIRPPAYATLSPVATAGIPLEDRMVAAGGELNRFRGQVEWEVTPQTFFKGYVDHKIINNNYFSEEVFTLPEQTELQNLRDRDFAALASEELTEWSLYPDFEKGNTTTFGVGLNHIVNDDFAIFGRYRYLRSQNTGDTHYGNDLPYIPAHHIAIGGTWIPIDRLYVVGRIDYATKRYTDESNATELSASPSFAFNVFWESPNKNILTRAGVIGLWDRNYDPFYSGELVIKF